jgi:phi13 family phage major tail protein
MATQIGLRSVYYAILNSDPAGGTPTYAAPVLISGAISANINPNTNSETLYADDGPYEVATTLGAISLELNMNDLDMNTQAALLGHTLSGGVLVRKSADSAPWVAVGFKSLKSNGKYRYTWLAKGKFELPEQKNETRGDKIAFQTPTIKGSFVKRDADDEWQRNIDEDHVDYIATMGTNWFTSPLQTADTTPPTISSILPLAAATGVAVGSTMAWTFDEALALSTVTTDNFMLVKDTDGAKVAGALTIDADRKIVTFTPTSNLTGATAYRGVVSAGVKDVYGNKFAGPSVNKFTTA